MDKKGGVTFFRRSFFPQIAQKTSCANPSVFQIYSGFIVFWMIGVSRFCRLFLSHNAKKFVENPPMIQKNRAPKNFMIIRGVSRFSMKNFWSHSTENLRGGTFLSFRKVIVRKKFTDKKGGVTFLRRNFFAPNRRNSSWANLSVFQNYSGFKIFWIIGSSQFCQFFCLTSPKITVGEHVCVSELFWFPNFLDNMGITILSILFVSQYRKFSYGDPWILWYREAFG